MTETITESFCERCGTRYAFESTATVRRGGIGRVRVLGRGLKNFIENDGLPMAEAMAAARDEEQRSGLTRQLDAFHKTFNFCMTCRQYTCPSCWNAKAGECLTCAPDLTREVLPAPFPDLPLEGPAAGNGHDVVEAAAWPRADLERMEPVDAATAAAAGAGAAPTAEPAPEPEPVVEAPDVLARLGAFVAVEAADDLTADELSEVQNALAASTVPAEPAAAAPAPSAAGDVPALPMAAEQPVEVPTAVREVPVEAAAAAEAAESAPEAHAPAESAEPEAVPDASAPPETKPAVDAVDAGRTQTRSLLGRFRPGRDVAAAAAVGAVASPAPGPAAPETIEAATVEPGAEPGRDAEAAPPVAPVVEAAPPVAPVVEAAPPAAPVAAEAAPVEAAEPAPVEAGGPPPPVDVVAQPTWSKVAPSVPGPDEPPAWPELPGTPAVPTPAPGPGSSPWAARLAISRPEPSGVWAASNREVLGASPQAGAPPAAVQTCVSCGLSLSANARFCRRCGSRQG